METSINKKSNIDYAVISTTINSIKEFAKENGYKVKGEENFSKINVTTFNEVIQNTTFRKRKKLADLIWKANNHPKLSTINKFLHFLMTKIYKTEDRIKILPSEKELYIQKKRKAYKEALTVMKAAYADYKEEKGDFYKNKI